MMTPVGDGDVPPAPAAPAAGDIALGPIKFGSMSQLDLSNNPYFSAGFGLGILGTGLALMRGASRTAVMLAQRHFLVTLEVTSKDRSYPWVLNLLTSQAGARTTMGQHLSVDTVVQKHASGRVTTRFDFQPCPGRHVLLYRSRYMLVERTREQQTVDLQTGKPWECLKLTTIGRSRAVFEDFLNDAAQLADTREEHTTTIYTNWGTEWRPFGVPRRRRPIGSVVLDDGVAESVLADVREFLGSSQWYIDRGIPYRRGYLLHGPPGSGKSSFIAALAGEIGYDICVLNLSEGGLTDDRLAHALSTLPPSSLVLLEDVDAAFVQREGNERHRSFVTFSGLLNTLDGVAAGEERIVFMTTNHIERLDPALVRPGRVDVIRRIGDASASQMERMFQKFFPPTEPEHADGARQFAAMLQGQAVSMAMLQGFFLTHKGSAAEALAHVPELQREIAELAIMQAQLRDARVSLQAADDAAAGSDDGKRGDADGGGGGRGDARAPEYPPRPL